MIEAQPAVQDATLKGEIRNLTVALNDAVRTWSRYKRPAPRASSGLVSWEKHRIWAPRSAPISSGQNQCIARHTVKILLG